MTPPAAGERRSAARTIAVAAFLVVGGGLALVVALGVLGVLTDPVVAQGIRAANACPAVRAVLGENVERSFALTCGSSRDRDAGFRVSVVGSAGRGTLRVFAERTDPEPQWQLTSAVLEAEDGRRLSVVPCAAPAERKKTAGSSATPGPAGAPGPR